MTNFVNKKGRFAEAFFLVHKNGRRDIGVKFDVSNLTGIKTLTIEDANLNLSTDFVKTGNVNQSILGIKTFNSIITTSLTLNGLMDSNVSDTAFIKSFLQPKITIATDTPITELSYESKNAYLTEELTDFKDSWLFLNPLSTSGIYRRQGETAVENPSWDFNLPGNSFGFVNHGDLKAFMEMNTGHFQAMTVGNAMFM